jgi:hypothetical protein
LVFEAKENGDLGFTFNHNVFVSRAGRVIEALPLLFDVAISLVRGTVHLQPGGCLTVHAPATEDQKYRPMGTPAIATSIMLRQGNFRRVRYWHVITGRRAPRRHTIYGSAAQIDTEPPLNYTPLQQEPETYLPFSKIDPSLNLEGKGMECPNCKFENPNGFKFCGSWAHPLETQPDKFEKTTGHSD